MTLFRLAAAAVFCLAPIAASAETDWSAFSKRMEEAATIDYKAVVEAGNATYDVTMPQADGSTKKVQLSAKAIVAYMEEFEMQAEDDPAKQPAPRPGADGKPAPVAAIGKRGKGSDPELIYLYLPAIQADAKALARILMHEFLALEDSLRPYNAAYAQDGWTPKVEAQMQAIMTRIMGTPSGASSLAGRTGTCKQITPNVYGCGK